MPRSVRAAAAAALAMLPAVAGCGLFSSQPLGFGPERRFADHREVDVRYLSRDATLLAGTLYLPPGGGPYPAIVFQFGSPRWTRAAWAGSAIPQWVDKGIAVLSYDRRGVGESHGTCCSVGDPHYFILMAGDLLGAIDVLKTHPDLDAARLGLFGFSQGGWVVPTAAAMDSQDVAFTVIGSGPAVTVGEEELYSVLTGDDQCTPTGLPPEEIERQLDSAGPSGFDPLPYLRRETTPGLWLFGGLDTSIPVARSIAHLEQIRDSLHKDFTIVEFPNANHELVDGGAMCQSDGPRLGVLDSVFAWLLPRVGS